MKFKKFPGVRDVALPIRFECESYFVESFIKVSDRRQKRDAVTAFKSNKFVYGFIVAFFVLS